LRDASGITRRFERAAKDGRIGATHHGRLLAEFGITLILPRAGEDQNKVR
jgi:hypothetical protein